MHCTECEFNSPQNMTFCGQCGHPLKLICPNCNFENPSNFKFCGKCASRLLTPQTLSQTLSQTSPQTSPPGAEKAIEPTAQLAERRQITVLFCDVVGSSQLSERLDPEDLRDIMRAYRATCNKVINAYSGYIAQYLGDGILAYYGFPTAHEWDARNAVSTAYELIHNLATLNQSLSVNKGVSLSIRLGIHTGEVVIGEIGGGDKRITALGETPNIASRLQDMAEANTIVISSATHQLAHPYIECVPLGNHRLKGFSRNFNLFKVIKPINYFANTQNSLVKTQAPLVGRDQESDLLVDKINLAKTGTGQVVLLQGEAGIGKSRLVQFIRESNLPTPYYLIESWGSQYYKNSYLYSIIETLKYFWKLSEFDNDKDKLKRIESALSSLDLNLKESIPMIAHLLSIKIDSTHYSTFNITPAQQNQQTLAVLLSIIKAMARQRLVVIIVEDLHWIDHTSLEFITLLIEIAPSINMFVLLSKRVNFVPPWPNFRHITHISINRLTRQQTIDMISWQTKNKKLPRNLLEEIINKTDGIPFFIDELTKMVLASDMLKERNECYELCAPLSSMSIPATLQDSLMEKLDKLGPNKSLAQLSATLGREFGHNLLKAVVSSDAANFESQISSLVGSELLYRRGSPPHASYTFQHALVQELAYHSLLRKTRQKYHHMIADTLIQQFPDRIREHPEILAHHCYEAGDTIESIKHLIGAGKLAINRSALIDAIVHLNRALTYLTELPESNVGWNLEIDIQNHLGFAYMLHNGYAASEVQAAFARSHELCKNKTEYNSLFPVLSGLWEYYIVRAEIETAHDIALQLEFIGTKQTDPRIEENMYRTSRRMMGSTLFWQGRLIEANAYLQPHDSQIPQTSASLKAIQAYSQDSEVARLANLACVTWLMGYPSKAINIAKQAINRATKLEHPFSIAYALNFAAIVYQLCGNTEELIKTARQLVEKSRTYDFNFWHKLGLLLCSWADINNEIDAKSIDRFWIHIRQYNDAGCYLASTYFKTLLIQAYIDVKEHDHALQLVNEYFDSKDGQKESVFKADFYRLWAKILLSSSRNNAVAAEESLLSAIKVSRNQGAKALELRATCDYCVLLKDLNRTEEARKILVMLFDQYSAQDHVDMKPFPDWIMAKQILCELEPRLNQGDLAGK